MADGDIFDRHVERGWRAAARAVFAPILDERGLDMAVRAAALDFKRSGCTVPPALLESLERASSRNEALAESLDRLSSLTQRHIGPRDRHAVDTARRWLLAVDGGINWPADVSRDERFVLDCITDHVQSRCFISSVIRDHVVSGHMSLPACEERRRELRYRLLLHPSARALAQQILEDTSGAAVRLPRYTAAKPALEELLHMGIG